MAKLLGACLNVERNFHEIQREMDHMKSDTCAFFISSPRGFGAPPLPPQQIKLFKATVRNPHILLPHAPLTINFANKELQPKHLKAFQKDVDRLHMLGIGYYNVHPGSDTNGLGREKALGLISESINSLKTWKVKVVIENTAGEGKKVGHKFEDLRDIIENVCHKERVGVCLDTCHLFGAGYDIRTREKFESVMQEFDHIVGLKYLCGVHINDSKKELGSRKDRHECIGKGFIGMEAFKYIMESDYFNDMPMILETPVPSAYPAEIALLRSFEKKNESNK